MAKFTGAAVVVSVGGALSLVTDVPSFSVERARIDATPLGQDYEVKELGVFNSIEAELTVLYDNEVNAAAIQTLINKMNTKETVPVTITYGGNASCSFQAKVYKVAPVATQGNNRLMGFVIGVVSVSSPQVTANV